MKTIQKNIAKKTFFFLFIVTTILITSNIASVNAETDFTKETNNNEYEYFLSEENNDEYRSSDSCHIEFEEEPELDRKYYPGDTVSVLIEIEGYGYDELVFYSDYDNNYEDNFDYTAKRMTIRNDNFWWRADLKNNADEDVYKVFFEILAYDNGQLCDNVSDVMLINVVDDDHDDDDARVYFKQLDDDKTYDAGDDFEIEFEVRGDFDDAEIWVDDDDGLRNVEFSDEWVYEDEEVTLSGEIPSSAEDETYEIKIKARAELNGDYDYETDTITIKVGEGDDDEDEEETCIISMIDTSGTQEINAGEIAEFTILTNNNSNRSKKIYYTSSIANANIIPSNISLNEGQSRFSTVQVYTSQSDGTGDYLLTVKGQANTCSDATVLSYKIIREDEDDDDCDTDSRVTMRFLNDDTVEPGQTGEFDIKITNTGCEKDNIELYATSETGRTPYFSKDFVSLEQDESIIVTMYTPTSKTNKDGHYDIRARAYVDGELVESIVGDLEIEEDEDADEEEEADIDVRALSGCKVVNQNEHNETLVTIKNRDNETHKVYLYLEGDINELNANLQSSTMTIRKDSSKNVLVRFRPEDLEAGRYYLTVEAEVNDEIVDDDEICIIVKESDEDTTTSKIQITDIIQTDIITPPTPPITPPTEPKKIIEIESGSVEESITAVPGETIIVKATVINNSNDIMDFTMRAQNLPNGWTYEKQVKTLIDGEKREMQITLTPSINNVTDAFIDIIITAEKYIDIEEIFIKTTDSIISKSEISISTESEEIREANLLKAIKITATITNNSNQTANNISPEITGLAGEFIMTSSPEEVTLQPNETKTITVMLAPKNALEHDYEGGLRFRGSNVLTEEANIQITKEGEFDLLTGFVTAANTGGLLPFLAIAFIILLASAVYLFRSSHSKKQINKIKKMTSYDGGLTEKTIEEKTNFSKGLTSKKTHPWSQRIK